MKTLEELKKQGVKISEREYLCLKALYKIQGEDYFDDYIGWARYKYIAQRTGLNFRKARIATRSLVRKGLAMFDKLFDDDGFLNGSGHHITSDGFNLLTKDK